MRPLGAGPAAVALAIVLASAAPAAASRVTHSGHLQLAELCRVHHRSHKRRGSSRHHGRRSDHGHARGATARTASRHRARHRRKIHIRVASRCPSAQTTATRLARGVTHGSVAARRRGLMRAMRALDVGVMSASGRPLTASLDHGAARYLSLYDFELQGIAQQLRKGVTESPTAFAAKLTAAAGGTLDIHGQPLSGDDLRALLVETTRSALHHRRDPGSRLALLVRALGRHHKGPRYDLAKAPRTAAIALDPLQSLLVDVGLVMPIVRRLHVSAHALERHGAARTAGASTAAVAASGGLTGLCDRMVAAENSVQTAVAKALGDTEGQRQAINQGVGYAQGKITDLVKSGFAWGLAKVAKRYSAEALKGAADAVGKWLAAANALHDILVSAYVRVDVPGGMHQTHWSHGDGQTGRPISFPVRVVMSVHLPKSVVACGPLVGMQFPAAGPIKDVPVKWSDDVNRNGGALGVFLHPIDSLTDDALTPDLGTTNCGTLPCVTKTAANGIATLVFTPRTEPIPGYGAEQDKHGHIYPTVLYETASGGGLFMGQIAQFLFPKGTTAVGWSPPAWQVGYHQVPNFYLSFTATLTPTQTDPQPYSYSIGCDVQGTMTQSGSLTMIGGMALRLTSAPDANPLTWQAADAPLQYTQTDLRDTFDETDSDCPPISPVGDGHHVFHTAIDRTTDGKFTASLRFDRTLAEVGGPDPGVTLTLDLLPPAPTEHYHDDTPGSVDDPPWEGWPDAVDQVLLPDSEQYSVALPRSYTIPGWHRGSPGSGAIFVKNIHAMRVIDNAARAGGPSFNVDITLKLGPGPAE